VWVLLLLLPVGVPLLVSTASKVSEPLNRLTARVLTLPSGINPNSAPSYTKWLQAPAGISTYCRLCGAFCVVQLYSLLYVAACYASPCCSACVTDVLEHLSRTYCRMARPPRRAFEQADALLTV
jgi:hypothetical protein